MLMLMLTLFILSFLKKPSVFYLTKFVVRFRKYEDNITNCYAKLEQRQSYYINLFEGR